MSDKVYDLCVIGCGTAGMMAAVKLVDNGYNDIIIIEKGKHRSNNGNENVTEGIGGCGSFSDSKVNLTHKVGGTVYELTGLKKYYELLKEQEDIWLRFAPTKEQKIKFNLTENINDRLFTPNEFSENVRVKALANNMDLITFPIRHLGTTNVFYICENIFEFLINNGVTILSESEMVQVTKNNDIFDLHYVNNATTKKIQSKNVLLVPGRSGGSFFKSIMNHFDLPLINGPIDIGVRCEAPSEIGNVLLDSGIYEPKFVYYSDLTKTKVRSFCYCREGKVAIEEYRNTGIKCVNGHSEGNGEKTGNLNFAVLASETFTEPFHQPQEYAEAICRLANLLAGGDVLVQRLMDLKSGRRSTPARIRDGATIPTLDATPGDLSLCIPQRQLTAIIEFLDKMDKVMPGIASSHTLLYGMEVKFYSNKVKIDNDSMTEINNLYVGGDGAGYCRGINQSSVNGLLIAEGILRKS